MITMHFVIIVCSPKFSESYFVTGPNYLLLFQDFKTLLVTSYMNSLVWMLYTWMSSQILFSLSSPNIDFSCRLWLCESTCLLPVASHTLLMFWNSHIALPHSLWGIISQTASILQCWHWVLPVRFFYRPCLYLDVPKSVQSSRGDQPLLGQYAIYS